MHTLIDRIVSPHCVGPAVHSTTLEHSNQTPHVMCGPAVHPTTPEHSNQTLHMIVQGLQSTQPPPSTQLKSDSTHILSVCAWGLQSIQPPLTIWIKSDPMHVSFNTWVPSFSYKDANIHEYILYMHSYANGCPAWLPLVYCLVHAITIYFGLIEGN